MVFKTISIGTDDVKEPLINSARNLHVISADQAGVMNVMFNDELKKNFKLFVHDTQSSPSTSR